MIHFDKNSFGFVEEKWNIGMAVRKRRRLLFSLLFLPLMLRADLCLSLLTAPSNFEKIFELADFPPNWNSTHFVLRDIPLLISFMDAMKTGTVMIWIIWKLTRSHLHYALRRLKINTKECGGRSMANLEMLLRVKKNVLNALMWWKWDSAY